MKFALRAGWTDENLIIFNDSGIPATGTLEKREGLQELLRAIEADEIKAVIINGEYSLWRDSTLVDVSRFIALCKQHKVIVATLERVYDFSQPKHIQFFRFSLESTNVAIYARTNKRSDIYQTEAERK